MIPRGWPDELAVAALVDTADPLSVFPSYGTIGVSSRFTDFLSNTTGISPYTVNGSGTGNTLSNAAAAAGRMGFVTLEAGTTATGFLWLGSHTASVVFGSGRQRWRADLFMPTASDATNTFAAYAGFLEPAGGLTTDGVFFRHDYTVFGGRWQCVSRSNNVETLTATDSGVSAVSAVCQALEIEVNAAGTQSRFFINGVLVGTHAANIPTGVARATGVGVAIVKSAGIVNRTITVDLMGDRFERTAAI